MNAVELGADYLTRIERDGYAIVANILSNALREELAASVSSVAGDDAIRRKQSIYGIRNLFEMSPAVTTLARLAAIRSLVTPILGEDCFAVRATYFDKVPGANWKVPWHQDTAIVVRKRIETDGFTAWSEKAGAIHVQPPEWVLLGMLAIRIHLDDCLADNGPLRMVAGSHTHRWPFDQVDEAKAKHREVVGEVAAGGVLVMRPLLLHASSPSLAPGHRRVVHIEYAAKGLPNGLEWRNRIV